MTPLESLEKIKMFVSCNHPQESVYLCETEEYKIIKNNLKASEILKSKLPFYIIEIQGYKYLAIKQGDIRRSDVLITITDEEYEILKEMLSNATNSERW